MLLFNVNFTKLTTTSYMWVEGLFKIQFCLLMFFKKMFVARKLRGGICCCPPPSRCSVHACIVTPFIQINSDSFCPPPPPRSYVPALIFSDCERIYWVCDCLKSFANVSEYTGLIWDLWNLAWIICKIFGQMNCFIDMYFNYVRYVLCFCSLI